MQCSVVTVSFLQDWAMVVVAGVGLLVGDVPRLVARPRLLLLLLSVAKASTLEPAGAPAVPSTGGEDWLLEDPQDWLQHSAEHPVEVGPQ